jgi:hypothetical protein
MQDLIGGQVDLAFLPSAGNLVDLVAQGKLRAYAITDGRRLARLPDLPTLAEAAGLKTSSTRSGADCSSRRPCRWKRRSASTPPWAQRCRSPSTAARSKPRAPRPARR